MTKNNSKTFDKIVALKEDYEDVFRGEFRHGEALIAAAITALADAVKAKRI